MSKFNQKVESRRLMKQVAQDVISNYYGSYRYDDMPAIPDKKFTFEKSWEVEYTNVEAVRSTYLHCNHDSDYKKEVDSSGYKFQKVVMLNHEIRMTITWTFDTSITEAEGSVYIEKAI